MVLSQIFLALGEATFSELLKTVSMGKLRTYQLFERVKVRSHLGKLNAESLRKAAPRLWTRLGAGEEELAQDLAQAILVSNLGLVKEALDVLGIPNEDGFFAKDINASSYLSAGWQQRVYDALKDKHRPGAIVFYVNHLAWELDKNAEMFTPAA
jgi:hypothetical protein